MLEDFRTFADAHGQLLTLGYDPEATTNAALVDGFAPWDACGCWSRDARAPGVRAELAGVQLLQE